METVTVSPKFQVVIPKEMRYLVVIERGESSWGAHIPDLPGCVAVGETREEVMELIKEAIDFHLEGLREHGEPIPVLSSESEFIETTAAVS